MDRAGPESASGWEFHDDIRPGTQKHTRTLWIGSPSHPFVFHPLLSLSPSWSPVPAKTRKGTSRIAQAPFIQRIC